MSKGLFKCLRHFFCWFNVLFWVVGCGIVGTGLWLRIAYEGYTTLLPHYSFLSADSLAICIGCITVIVSTLACCGSWFKNKYLLITYFGLVLCLIIFQFTIGIISVIFQHYVEHSLTHELVYGISHHYNVSKHTPNSLVNVWDRIQKNFQCCGVDNYENWYMIDAWPTQRWVPDSCCLPEKLETNCGQQSNPDIYYSDGCYDKIFMWIIRRLIIIESVALIVAFIELSGLIISMLLYCAMKNREHSVAMYKPYSRR